MMSSRASIIYTITAGDLQCDWFKCYLIKKIKVSENGKSYRSRPEDFSLAALPLVAVALGRQSELSALGHKKTTSGTQGTESPKQDQTSQICTPNQDKENPVFFIRELPPVCLPPP